MPAADRLLLHPSGCLYSDDAGGLPRDLDGGRRLHAEPVRSADRLLLRRAYHRLFRSKLRLQAAIAEARREFGQSALVLELVEFVASTRRGVCRVTGSRLGSPESASAEA